MLKLLKSSYWCLWLPLSVTLTLHDLTVPRDSPMSWVSGPTSELLAQSSHHHTIIPLCLRLHPKHAPNTLFYYKKKQTIIQALSRSRGVEENISGERLRGKAGERERQAEGERERCHWLCVPAALFLPCSAAQGPCALKQHPSLFHTHTHTHIHTHTCCVWPVSHGSTCQLLTTSSDTLRESKRTREREILLQTQQGEQTTDLCVQMGPLLLYNTAR